MTRLFCIVITVSIASFAAPAAFGDMQQPDLAAQAEIRRDTYGVPHILAETEPAAAFAYGYAAAEDHVLTMARLYLKARGEEAKYFGSDFVESDLLVKRHRNYDVAERGYSEAMPWWRAMVDAYALGYNHYLEKHRDKLPEWVIPISGVDVLAHGRRVVVMEFCSNYRQIEALQKKLEKKTAKLDVNPEWIGSNMWAVNKDRSATGNAILLGNPHLRWSGSHTWHEVHMTVKDAGLNFMGGTLVGFPGAGLGFNEHLGWSHTVNPHDCDDIYALKADPKNDNAYLYEGQSVPLKKETISVEVKTDSGLESREFDVFRTHYGPVVARDGDTIYAYKSANAKTAGFMQQWYLMSKAQNLDEFRRALDIQAIPMFNICYADKEGNCFYVFNGRFPQRPQGYDWSGVVEGGVQATEWYTVLPQDKLPQLLNPSGGYVQNCNSAPWYTNLNEIVDRRDFPAEIAPNDNSLRTQHSLMLIEKNKSITLEEVLRDKFSMGLLLADRVKPDLLKIARGETVDGIDLSDAVAVLKAWDNRVARDSKGAILFVNFWNAYERIAKPVYETSWDEKQPATTPQGIGDPQAALKALATAATETKKTLGALDAPWGAVFRLRKGDVDIPIGGFIGDFGAFRIIGYEQDDDGRFRAIGGDSYVFAVEFADRIKSHSILAYSQSNDPDSPHYTDQSELFANNQFKPAWFYEEDIQANLERTYRP